MRKMKRRNPLYFVCAILMCVTLAGCGPPALITAAKSNDTKKMETLLNKGAEVNEEWFVGSTALWWAVRDNVSLETVRFLLDKGADVNKGMDNGWTPLLVAIYNGNAKMVKLLLDYGADITGREPMGHRTPVQLAEEKGHVMIVRMLGEYGQKQHEKLYAVKTDRISASPSPNRRIVAGGDVTPSQAMVKGTAIPLASSKDTSFKSVSVMNPLSSDVDDLPQVQAQMRKHAYAIVIGVEKYRQKLPKADFAAHDARIMAEYLAKVMGYPEENIVTLINDRALKSDMEKYFEKWLSNNVEKEGTVFVYYSGHGAPNPNTGDAYLVPYDGDPSFIEQTGYSLKRMYDALGKLQAKEIIVALDSCFSGAGGRSVIAKGARPLVMNLQNNMVLSKNMTVLSASSGEQISSTYDEKGHGLFTYFLLKGIKNEDVVRQDGSIAVSDLFSYIKPQVKRISRKRYNNEQTPQLIVFDNP